MGPAWILTGGSPRTMTEKHHADQPTDDRKEHPRNGRNPELLRTGTYLHTRCPSCGHDLVEKNWVRLRVTNAAGDQGQLRLSPRLNVFQRECDIPLQPGTEMRDLTCPNCGASIVEPHRHCSHCSARTAKLHVSVVRLDLVLYICLRVGCPWHGLGDEDEGRVVLDEDRGK